MNVSKNASVDVTNFEQILDNCVARLQAGESVEQCLADYPERDGELRTLLMTVSAVQDAPMPAARPQAAAQGQAMMLAALAGREREAAVSFGTLRRYAGRILSVLKQEEAFQMRSAFRSIITTIVIILVSSFFALAISANSLPGEPFYPVKLGWESIRVGLTFDEYARQELEAQIQQSRRQELEALIELGRQTQVVYEGVVEQIEEERLIVDGFDFETTLETRWLIEPEVGEAVRIETEITAEGELVALEISAGLLDFRPQVILTATATPTPIPTDTPGGPTPTPCNTPTCAPTTATPTPCNDGACVTASPTPVPTSTPGGPTPTPCNTPACAPPTPTPCNTGACGDPTQTPPPTVTPGNPTPTPCNSPACAPPTSTPTPCQVGCGNPSPTPVPSSTPGNPTPTPCNAPACSPPTPTPCNTGVCGGPTPTPPPTNIPGSPTPTPCNSPACQSPTATPTTCNAGMCGGLTPTPAAPTATPGNDPPATPCNTPACSNSPAAPPY